MNTLQITGSDDASATYTMAAAKLTNIQNITISSAGDVVADVSGTNVTGLEKITVLKSAGADITASATQNIEISGATGAIVADGGKNISISDATANQAITIGNGATGPHAAGTITVTDTKQGTGNIVIDGGTDVTVTTTVAVDNNAAVANGGDVTIGANEEASGAVVVTQNLTSDGGNEDGDDLAGANIAVTGGSTVDVTINATVTAKDKNAEGDITVGTVTVDGDGSATSVKVTQNATATKFTTPAVTLVKATQDITFKDLAKNATVTVNGLTFTASKNLTAAEVAQAFANLSAS